MDSKLEDGIEAGVGMRCGVQVPPVLSCRDVAEQVLDRCIEVTHAEEWSASEEDTFAKEISDEVLRRARAVGSEAQDLTGLWRTWARQPHPWLG